MSIKKENSNLITCKNCGLKNRHRDNCIKCGQPLTTETPQSEESERDTKPRVEPEPKTSPEPKSKPKCDYGPKTRPEPNYTTQNKPQYRREIVNYGFNMNQRKVILFSILGIVLVVVGNSIAGAIGTLLYLVGFILLMNGATYLYMHFVKK